MLFGLISFCAFNYHYAPWTTLIEISLTLFWGYLSWVAATSESSKLAILSNWPHLALGMLLINWPTAQVLLDLFPALDKWTLPALSLPLSLAFTAASYWIVTRRADGWIQMKLNREIPV